MALRTLQRLEEVEAADGWAERLRSASDAGAAPLATALAAFVSGHPPLTPTFVARFLQQLRTYQTNFTPLVWLEQWIAEDSLSAEDAVARSNQRLALTQVMMANSITSLRTIARLDWSAFVEGASAVEAVLRRDPTGDYPMMTFQHARQVPARRRGHCQGHRSRGAGCRAARARPGATRMGVSPQGGGGCSAGPGRRHPTRRGSRRGRVRYGPSAESRRLLSRRRRPGTVGGQHTLPAAVAAPTAPLDALACRPRVLRRHHLADDRSARHRVSTRRAVGRGVAARGPALRPDPGQRHRDQHDAPAADGRAAAPRPAEVRLRRVRHSALLCARPSSCRRCSEASRRWTKRWSTSRSSSSPIVTRTCSSPCSATSPTRRPPTCEGDGAILDAAVHGIETLNARYPSPPGQGDSFFLFHRHRLWNPRQGVWMGWERKRGKLAQFNRYLRGGARDAFSVIAGDTRRLPDVRYVITLDSDTVLPRGTAATLVGAIAHPLNRAIYDLGERPGRRGIRDPAAPHWDHAHERQPVAVRRDLLRPSGRRSVHDRRLRRLSGSVRRRELHRQRHLRRRRVRAGDARAVPREHAPQPRPDRGRLLARGARDRRGDVRRLPDALPRRSRGASTGGSAATGSCFAGWARACRAPTAPSPIDCRRSRAGRSSTTSDAASSRSRSCCS